MSVAVGISDVNFCSNGSVRQAARFQTLFGITPHMVGISHGLEAALCLVDTLDAVLGVDPEANGVIAVNKAPREGIGKQFPNGPPFCYFYVGRILVVSTYHSGELSLLKSVGLLNGEVHTMDIPTVVEWARKRELISVDKAESIPQSSFRSFEFVPLALMWIQKGLPVPSTPISKGEEGFLEPPEPSVSCVDKWAHGKYGNCKLTILDKDARIRQSVAGMKTRFFSRLKDVPDDRQPALIVGSSGYGKHRFLELVVQGGNAGKILGLEAGSSVADFL
jgi:hypothetical protein